MAQQQRLPYNPRDKASILEYASRLTGKTLRKMGIEKGKGKSSFGKSAKGYFGQTLEEGYFLFDNNDNPDPDFKEAGLELKSSPMVKRKKGMVAKERLVLGIINYEEVPIRGWDTFYYKDKDLLLVFYEWQKAKDYLDYKIIKVAEWTYTDEDMRIIREDWEIIEGYILRGKAEDLSERFTRYLSACTKGAGHGKDMRRQPYSDVLAKQRALSLKASYMTSVFNKSEGLVDEDSQSLDLRSWSADGTFEDTVIEMFDRFVGLDCDEIEGLLGIGEAGKSDKGYYATLCRRMLGVTTKKIEQFEKADIKMKTIRLKTNGIPKESMSFPYLNLIDTSKETDWEDSRVFSMLDKRYLIPVFQMTHKGKESRDDKGTTRFLGAFFWALPDVAFDEACRLWELIREKIDESDVDALSHKMSTGETFHTRPHGRNSNDKTPLPDGQEVTKFGIWITNKYLGKVVGEHMDPKSGFIVPHGYKSM